MSVENFDFGNNYLLPNPEISAFSSGSDDYEDNASTTGVVTVGGWTPGALEVSADTDWFAVTLVAGQTYGFSLFGLSLSDPYIRVYNSSGTLLGQNDDGPWGTFDSYVQITATYSGTYYVEADNYSTETGTYVVTVDQINSTSSPTSNPLLTDIDWGTQMPSNTINVYFAPAGYFADGYDAEGFNAYERGQFLLAFQVIESYTNLTFNVVTNPANADLILLLDTDQVLGSFLGYFNPPGTVNDGVAVFDGTQWDRAPGGDLERGGYGFVTIVHELLHGLGLAHPHDDGGTSTIMTGVTAPFDDFGTWNLNQGVFTTMSYNSGWHTGPAGTGPFTSGTYGFEGGPMAIDIAALQENYGTNTTYNNGNTIYTLPTVNATGTYFLAIWDTGGSDTIAHSGTLAATIDLRAATITEAVGGGGWVSHAAGIAGGFTIAHGVVIENAVGGGGNDRITGNDTNNHLSGNGGRDTITGNAGQDTLVGGGGYDTLRGGLGNDTLLGGIGRDRLEGGGGNDVLQGGSDNDTLLGNSGNDTLRGYGGNDLAHGGGGRDHVAGGAGRDTISGNLGNDLLLGNGGYDTLFGGGGDDTLIGGIGFDRLDGGLGDDVLIGGLNADRFVFADGHGDDVINDFDALNNSETIILSAVSAITSYADLAANHMTQVGLDVVIDTGGGNSITLLGVNLADLDANDFVF